MVMMMRRRRNDAGEMVAAASGPESGSGSGIGSEIGIGIGRSVGGDECCVYGGTGEEGMARVCDRLA
jgi:hypothetical protein